MSQVKLLRGGSFFSFGKDGQCFRRTDLLSVNGFEFNLLFAKLYGARTSIQIHVWNNAIQTSVMCKAFYRDKETMIADAKILHELCDSYDESRS